MFVRGKLRIKKRMSQREAYEWERHQKLDKMIDDMDIKVLAYQREFLHRSLDRKVYITMLPRMGITDSRILAACCAAMFDSYEKEKKDDS